MERRPLGADLAHVAQNEPAHAGRAREHLDGRAHRVGVRVVAVVDHEHARGGAFRDQPPGDGAECREAASDRVERCARGKRRGRGRECVARHRLAGDREAHRRVARPRADREVGAVGGERRARRHVGGRAAPEGAHLRARPNRRVAPDAAGRVVGVQHRDAAGGKRGDRVRVLGGDLGDACHELLVLALGVVDDDDRRPRDRRELARLAAVVHPELDHRRAVALAQPQQRQREPDRVVEVARRRERRAFAPGRPQDRRGHLLDRRLAVAPDDDRERQAEARAPVGGETPERRERIGHGDDRAGKRAAAVRDQRRRGAAAERARDEVVAVEALAGARRAQLAARAPPRGPRHPRGAGGGAGDPAATNRSPGSTARESVVTRVNRTLAPSTRPCTAWAAVARSIMQGSGPRAPRPPRARPRTAAARRRPPGRSRDPCRRR